MPWTLGRSSPAPERPTAVVERISVDRPGALAGDVAGTFTSALCLVHCLAVPALASSGAHFFHHPLVSGGFVVAAGAAVWAASRSGPGWMKGLLWSCWTVFAVAIWLEHHHPLASAVGMMASLGLVGGHLLNLRGRQRGRACSGQPSHGTCGPDQGA